MTNLGGFPGGAMIMNPPANARDAGETCSIPVSGRSPVGCQDNPLKYSCLEKSHRVRYLADYSP